MKRHFDLLGVAAQLGSEIAKGSIRYINANPKRCIASFLVIPGLYEVSAQMLKRSDSYVSRIFSPGYREDKKVLVGLSSTGKYKYIGTKSGTPSQVNNILCEGWLNKTLQREGTNSYIIGKGRHTAVLSSLLQNDRHGEELKHTKSDPTIISAFLQVGTLASFGYMLSTKDIAGIAISAANMISSLLVTASIIADKYTIPKSMVSLGVPDGNAIVTDQAGNNLCVINGKEEHIQSFMQLEIKIGDLERNDKDQKRNKEIQKKNDTYSTAAATIGCMTSIGTILFTPLMSDKAQQVFGIELIFGLLSCILFSSRDGDEMLEQMAHKYYGNEPGLTGGPCIIPSAKVIYTNRATAIAAALIETGGKADNIGNLLPDVDLDGNWKKYKKLLDNVIAKENLPQMSDMKSLAEAINAMSSMFPDTAGVLTRSDGFAPRLVVDVLEAIVQLQGIKPNWTRI